MSSDTAVERYAALVQQIKEMAECIAADAENHFGEDPDAINYSHVGTLAEVNSLLESACTALAIVVPSKSKAL